MGTSMKKLIKSLNVNNSVQIYLRCNQTMKLFFLACILSSISMTAHTVHAENKKIKLDSAIIKGLTSGEYVILLRHALAPGFGDPNSFDVSDCSSQRNLSEQGRRQASKQRILANCQKIAVSNKPPYSPANGVVA